MPNATRLLPNGSVGVGFLVPGFWRHPASPVCKYYVTPTPSVPRRPIPSSTAARQSPVVGWCPSSARPTSPLKTDSAASTAFSSPSKRDLIASYHHPRIRPAPRSCVARSLARRIRPASCPAVMTILASTRFSVPVSVFPPSTNYYCSRLRTRADSSRPSALPPASAVARPITLPISFMLDAPVSSIARSTI